MFEDYLQDAAEFLKEGNRLSQTGNTREAQRHYRAAIFCTAGAMEAFVNYIADSFAKAEKWTQFETAYLNDKTLWMDHGVVKEKQDFHRLEDKIRFLLKKFPVDFDLGSASWSNFVEIKKLRDSLIHPRTDEDSMSVQQYKENINKGLSGLIHVMNFISIGIFQRPLRPQLLDLIPEN